MRTFVSPNFKPALNLKGAAQSGFTLIEILVVLFIITVLAGLTVARLPGFVQSADLETEARRLELLLNMARTEAMLDSSEFGFQLTDNGYEFLRFDDGSQSWMQGESPFHARDVPEEIRLTIRAEEPEFSLPADDLPAVLILSSGESTPFDLILETKTERRELTTDGYSEFAPREDDR